MERLTGEGEAVSPDAAEERAEGFCSTAGCAESEVGFAGAWTGVLLVVVVDGFAPVPTSFSPSNDSSYSLFSAASSGTCAPGMTERECADAMESPAPDVLAHGARSAGGAAAFVGDDLSAGAAASVGDDLSAGAAF